MLTLIDNLSLKLRLTHTVSTELSYKVRYLDSIAFESHSRKGFTAGLVAVTMIPKPLNISRTVQMIVVKNRNSAEVRIAIDYYRADVFLLQVLSISLLPEQSLSYGEEGFTINDPTGLERRILRQADAPEHPIYGQLWIDT